MRNGIRLALGQIFIKTAAPIIGLNAQGRLVTPIVAADQYSEITYSQDPGASSWVGVTTRMQSATNGSGYLAIAYAGAVQPYRADDTGSLTFTQLASTIVNISVAPRRLRLESQGNTHRVFLNGTQVLNHTASGTIYTTGQPGIAASVFSGPVVEEPSFKPGTWMCRTRHRPSVKGLPVGTLGSTTTQATLSLATSENGTCR